MRRRPLLAGNLLACESRHPFQLVSSATEGALFTAGETTELEEAACSCLRESVAEPSSEKFY